MQYIPPICHYPPRICTLTAQKIELNFYHGGEENTKKPILLGFLWRGKWISIKLFAKAP